MQSAKSSGEWGLVAMARSGDWQTDLSHSDDGKWLLEIQHSRVYLTVIISGPAAIREMLSFISATRNTKAFSEHECGGIPGGALQLVKDNQYADRYFLKFLSTGLFCEVALDEKDIAHLVVMLKSLDDELRCNPGQSR